MFCHKYGFNTSGFSGFSCMEKMQFYLLYLKALDTYCGIRCELSTLKRFLLPFTDDEVTLIKNHDYDQTEIHPILD